MHCDRNATLLGRVLGVAMLVCGMGQSAVAGALPDGEDSHSANLVATDTRQPAEVLLLDRAFPGALGLGALITVGATMGLRYWAIATLGPRWNTRVLVVPGLPAVDAGPYRYLKHPNYLAVILEIAALPLVHGAWLTAVVFSVANAALLRVRIRCEEAALTAHCAYADRLAGRPVLLPARRAR